MRFRIPSIRLILVAALVVAGVPALLAQDDVAVMEAERSIPFGVVSGHIVAVSDQLIFVDDDRLERSMALRRDNVSQASSDDGVLRIRTTTPVDNTSDFTFRLDSQSAEQLVGWVLADPAISSGPASASRTPTVSSQIADSTENGGLGQFRVEHEHFLGECSGILLITNEGIEFQSTTDADHSRRWDTADIKELERGDRDDLRIEPVIGNGYNFTFTGDRLVSNADFRALSDRVAIARLGTER